jgi:hypothetical protein
MNGPRCIVAKRKRAGQSEGHQEKWGEGKELPGAVRDKRGKVRAISFGQRENRKHAIQWSLMYESSHMDWKAPHQLQHCSHRTSATSSPTTPAWRALCN